MSGTPLLEIDDLHVSTFANDIAPTVELLGGVSLTVHKGEIHAVLGSSSAETAPLAAALLGSPDSHVTAGRILFRGDDITDWGTDVRSKAGLFLGFQRPEDVAGVSILTFLHQALSCRPGMESSVLELRGEVITWLDRLGMEKSFLDRHLNEATSTHERIRGEILQMAILEPKMAIFDETDLQLDSDALRSAAIGIQEIRTVRPAMGTLVITQNRRLLDHLQPDHVHILNDGKVGQ